MIRHESENSKSGYFFRSRIRSNSHLPLSCNSHFHSSFELISVIEGSFLLTVNGTRISMSDGELMLVFPFSVHSFEFDMSKPFRFWIVSFSGNFVNSFLRSMENRQGLEQAFTLSNDVRSFADAVLFSEERESTENLLLTKSVLYAITSDYLKSVPIRKKNASERAPIAELVTEYVRNHYAEKLSLNKMARDLGYSYSYLSHGFSRLFNLSFSSYLNLYRIDQAELLLLNTDLSIMEIAGKTGFTSIRNFNYVFQSTFGNSPRNYRKAKSMTR